MKLLQLQALLLALTGPDGTASLKHEHVDALLTLAAELAHDDSVGDL